MSVQPASMPGSTGEPAKLSRPARSMARYMSLSSFDGGATGRDDIIGAMVTERPIMLENLGLVLGPIHRLGVERKGKTR